MTATTPGNTGQPQDTGAGLNQDVFAGDVLRAEYRHQMDEHAHLAAYASELRDDLERVEARQRTAAERATSLMETLAGYGGMLAPDESGQ